MILTDNQLDRYARHIVLPEIGGKGQKNSYQLMSQLLVLEE